MYLYYVVRVSYYYCYGHSFWSFLWGTLPNESTIQIPSYLSRINPKENALHCSGRLDQKITLFLMFVYDCCIIKIIADKSWIIVADPSFLKAHLKMIKIIYTMKKLKRAGIPAGDFIRHVLVTSTAGEPKLGLSIACKSRQVIVDEKQLSNGRIKIKTKSVVLVPDPQDVICSTVRSFRKSFVSSTVTCLGR